MAQLTSNDIGKIMSFQVYPSAILGTNFVNAELVTLGSHLAVSEFEPAILHTQVFPTIPANIAMENDYRKYLYGKFKLENGRMIVVGLPWIKMDTLVFSTNQVIKVSIRGLSAASDTTRLKNILLAAGIIDFEIKVEG